MQMSKATVIDLNEGDELIVRYMHNEVSIQAVEQGEGVRASLIGNITVKGESVSFYSQNKDGNGNPNPQLEIITHLRTGLNFGDIDSDTNIIEPDPSETITSLAFFR